MPRLLPPLLAPLLPLTLTTLSFAFILTSLLSPRWTSQASYDPSLDMTDWSTPLFTRLRSPFQICEPSSTSTTSNDTITTVYTLQCQRYPAYGFGKTSCESVFAIKSYSEARAGDARLCEQIHRSGDLVIVATAFITLGFTLTLLLALLSLFPLRSSSSPTSTTVNGDTTTPHASNTHHKRKSHLTPLLNIVLITSLSIGGIAALLSQFYGILAFVQSQPPNGAWASGRGNVIDPTLDNASGPWTEGVVLRAYLTCAWVFAAFGAGGAGAVW